MARKLDRKKGPQGEADMDGFSSAWFLAGVALGYMRRTGELKNGLPEFESLVHGRSEASVNFTEWEERAIKLYERHTNEELERLALGDN
jgi:hypothetical protein